MNSSRPTTCPDDDRAAPRRNYILLNFDPLPEQGQ